MKGMKTILKKNRIVIENLNGLSTCFVKVKDDCSTQISQYSGSHALEPEGLKNLMSINSYTDNLILHQREEFAKESLINLFTYEYATAQKERDPRLPMERRCVKGSLNGQIVRFDNRGYITSGSRIKDENLVKFSFEYRKNAKFADELLRAEYHLSHISVKVCWSVPHTNHPERLDKWIPYSKVMEATFVQGENVYHSSWQYEHKWHPIITTTLNGEPIETPPMIQHDWFDVLSKPKNCRFLDDNPLLSFKSLNSNLISRALGLNTRWYPTSTSSARTHLWKLWKNGKELDAVTTRWLDEKALRSDQLLKPYWRARDMGRLDAAELYVHSQADNIMAKIDINPEISSWTLIAFKISDLLSMGQGGDARINTRTQSTQLHDSDNELHVVGMDTGTWPIESGGVSACRRDMVDNLNTIRWHILAESANDFGCPRFQVRLLILPIYS